MPTYQNTSDKVLEGIVGVGRIEPGEVKVLGDVIEHPSLKRVDSEETERLNAVEPNNNQAPTEAQLIDEQPVQQPAVQPQDAAPNQVTTQPAQAAPAQAPQQS